MAFSRLGGIGALGFVVIVLSTNAALEAGNPPKSGATPADIATFFTEHATVVEFGAAGAALAWLCMAVFGAAAATRIRRLERDRGEGWSLVGLVGIVLVPAMFGPIAATRLALVGNPGSDLWHLHNALFTMNNMSLVFVLVGFSIGGIRTATIRPWHASVGLASAALIFAATMIGAFTVGGGPGGLSLLGFVGWLLWLVWLGAFGVVLLRRGSGVAVKVLDPAV